MRGGIGYRPAAAASPGKSAPTRPGPQQVMFATNPILAAMQSGWGRFEAGGKICDAKKVTRHNTEKDSQSARGGINETRIRRHLRGECGFAAD